MSEIADFIRLGQFNYFFVDKSGDVINQRGVICNVALLYKVTLPDGSLVARAVATIDNSSNYAVNYNIGSYGIGSSFTIGFATVRELSSNFTFASACETSEGVSTPGTTDAIGMIPILPEYDPNLLKYQYITKKIKGTICLSQCIAEMPWSLYETLIERFRVDLLENFRFYRS